MTPKRAFLAIHAAVRAMLPLFLWGSPGVGKSAIVAQFCLWFFSQAENNDGNLVSVNLRDVMRDVRAVLLDPVDVKGLPVPDMPNDVVRWMIANFFPRDGRGILFLDELNAAPRLVQAALYQLILDRRIGDYELPAGWYIIAAGNLETDRAIVERMSTALRRRFIHVVVEPDAKEWLEYAAAHDFHPVILALIKAKPELISNFDPRSEDRTFCCPATLEYASRLLFASPDASIELELMNGTVGMAAGGEVIAFKRYLDEIPDRELILKNPVAAPVPDFTTPRGVGILCTLLAMLSRAANFQNFANILKYAERLPEEFRVFLVTSATSRDENLQSTAEFIRFASTHSELMV